MHRRKKFESEKLRSGLLGFERIVNETKANCVRQK